MKKTSNANERAVLTTGRLDGLVITPIGDESGLKFLDLTVDSLPGLRLIVEAKAAEELRDALTIIISSFIDK
jgi:hypothetical protein